MFCQTVILSYCRTRQHLRFAWYIAKLQWYLVQEACNLLKQWCYQVETTFYVVCRMYYHVKLTWYHVKLSCYLVQEKCHLVKQWFNYAKRHSFLSVYRIIMSISNDILLNCHAILSIEHVIIPSSHGILLTYNVIFWMKLVIFWNNGDMARRVLLSTAMVLSNFSDVVVVLRWCCSPLKCCWFQWCSPKINLCTFHSFF